ncbi:5360_t:CDS:2 [Gigaspora margarita]|uniref:5360_t:CDS:1 n=1 Tax=Gigaspora margarita TaxID=4874 RepID=A0ABN7UK15_GIGMA|nr:5360_t:CDS:2 [Gigaspora margarita]
MDQSQNQTHQPRNNTDQLQRLNNITLNTDMLSLRPRDTTNPSDAFDGVQQFIDLFSGFSFTGAREVETPQPQITQFSTQLISEEKRYKDASIVF